MKRSSQCSTLIGRKKTTPAYKRNAFPRFQDILWNLVQLSEMNQGFDIRRQQAFQSHISTTVNYNYYILVQGLLLERDTRPVDRLLLSFVLDTAVVTVDVVSGAARPDTSRGRTDLLDTAWVATPALQLYSCVCQALHIRT